MAAEIQFGCLSALAVLAVFGEAAEAQAERMNLTPVVPNVYRTFAPGVLRAPKKWAESADPFHHRSQTQRTGYGVGGVGAPVVVTEISGFRFVKAGSVTHGGLLRLGAYALSWLAADFLRRSSAPLTFNTLVRQGTCPKASSSKSKKINIIGPP